MNKQNISEVISNVDQKFVAEAAEKFETKSGFFAAHSRYIAAAAGFILVLAAGVGAALLIPSLDKVPVVPGGESAVSTVSEQTPSTPETSVPDVSAPDVSAPDVSTPDVSTPDVSTPDVSTPVTSDPITGDPVPPVVSKQLSANFNNATLYFNSVGLGAESAGLVYALNDDKQSYSVYSGSCNAQVVTIPDTHDGLPVTVIGMDAFSGSKDLVAIEIPETVTIISASAFAACPNLDAVYYSGSSELWSFVDAKWEPYVIPYSEGLSFVLCTDSDEPYYVFGGIGTCTAQDIVIPATYKGLPVKFADILDDAGEKRHTFFEDDNIISITFCEGITSIDAEIAQNCSNLKCIYLPKTLNVIYRYAFWECDALEHVSYSGTREQWEQIDISFIGEPSRKGIDTYYAEYHVCYERDQIISKTHCPATCTACGSDLYSCPDCGFTYDHNCENEPALGHNFENGVCLRCGVSDSHNPHGELTWVYFIDNGAVTITAYTGTQTTVTVPQYIEGYPVKFIDMNTEDVYQIANNRSGNIETLILSDGVDTIVSVKKCNILKHIEIPSTVTRIEHEAFKQLRYLTDIVIPDNVKYIGYEAFYDCIRLESVTLSKNLKTIGDLAFKGCESLKSIEMSDTVTLLGYSVFINCTSLERVVLSRSLTRLNAFTFNGCHNLKDVYLPVGITFMQECFTDCDGLQNVYYEGAEDDRNAIEIILSLNEETSPICSLPTWHYNQTW